MILHRPDAFQREADENLYGSWQWCFYRRIGPWLVVCDWVRCKGTHVGNMSHYVWRNANNCVFYAENLTESAW